MSWKEMSVMEQKEEFILMWKSGKFTVTNLAIMFDISRSTAYKFIDRYKEFGFPGLKEKDKTPKHIPNKTPELIVEKLIELRAKHKSWGPRKLLVLLEAELPSCKLPKESTVSLILKRKGLVKSRKRRYKTEPVHPIFDPKKCNEVWSADFKGQFRMGNKIYCYPLTIADSYSRYVFSAKGMRNPNTKGSKAEFIKIFRRYGLPEQIHTDNGSPFANVRSLGRLSK